MRQLFKNLFTAVLGLAAFSGAYAQTEQFSQKVNIPLKAATVVSLKPDNAFSLKKRIIKSDFGIQLDLGETYDFGKYPFKQTVSISLKAFKGNNVVQGVFDKSEYTIEISPDAPKALFYRDFSKLKTTTQGDDAFTFDRIDVTVNSVSAIDPKLASSFRFNMSLNTEYGFDVRNIAGPKILNIEKFESTKTMKVNWEQTDRINNYQLQIIRLFNTDEATAVKEDEITTSLDWSKAMNIEVKPANVKLLNLNNVFIDAQTYNMTVPSGTGYYAVRVRPVSSYFEGGLGNSNNWGTWSNHPAENQTIVLTPNNKPLPFFFYKDPNENLTWIYSRVFSDATERPKESITFANSIGQGKQGSIYLPSSNVTLTTQTVYDYAGRPSLVTIPVPEDGKKLTYKEKFVKPKGANELYRDKNFDEPDNQKNPTQVDQSQGAFSYYNGKIPQVPDAEGYPYARTLFGPDGRVVEQSGIGAAYMVGDQKDGRGYTTKYFYGTPAEDELIALFGDEAPSAESVIKFTTVDPDNVATVTYTSKEGNVLATAMSFYEGAESTALLPVDGVKNEKKKIKDKITANVKVGDRKFVSSKRVTLLQNNPDFQISYSIPCKQAEQLCKMAELKCDYNVRVYIQQLKQDGTIEKTISVFDQKLDDIACQDINGVPYKVIPAKSLNLSAGHDYYIVKELVAGDKSKVQIQDNLANIKLQNSIPALVSSWLESVKCEEMLNAFFESLEALSKSVNNADLENFKAVDPRFPFTISNEFWSKVYTKETKELYKLNISYDDGNPVLVAFHSPCCEPIHVPVTWIKPMISASENPYFTDNNGDGIPNPADFLKDSKDKFETNFDFEGMAIAMIQNTFKIRELADKSYGGDAKKAAQAYLYNGAGTMSGKAPMQMWQAGWFNMMVYNMLTDKYNANNTASNLKENQNPDNNEQQTLYYDECGNPVKDKIGIKCDGDKCTQYTPSELIDIWSTLVKNMQVQLNGVVAGEMDDSYEISKNYDGQYGKDENKKYPPGDEKNEHDKHFKGAMVAVALLVPFGPAVVASVISKIRNAKANTGKGNKEGDKQNPDPLPEQTLVYDFLEATGYRFAKIVTNLDAKPLAEDTSPDFGYSENTKDPQDAPLPVKRVVPNDYLQNFGKKGGGFYYAPMKEFVSVQKIYDPEGNYFPLTDNPFYAFKYFTYENHGKPEYASTEANVCFDDPNDCYAMDGQFMKLDPQGNPIKVPCCGDPNDPNNLFCHEDYEYPNLAAITVGKGKKNGKEYKAIVGDFCGKGRIRCPYTHEFWSAGQRFSFYKMVKNMKFEDDNTDWTAAKYQSCEDYTKVDAWYKNEGGLKGYAEYIPASKYNGLSAEVQKAFVQEKLSKDGQEYTNFSLVEMQIMEKVGECNDDCEKRRPDIKAQILQMLEDKCYQVGGCKEEGQNQIVPEADINKMVDALVGACKDQCKLTTFSCADSMACRDFDMPKTMIGSGSATFKLQYGIAGYPNSPQFCDGNQYAGFDDDKCLQYVGGVLSLKRCPEFVNNMEEALYSNYEYTKMEQAKHWFLELTLPSMCTENKGEKDFNCCGNVGENMTKGDTYMPKQEYTKYDNTPVDLNDNNLKKPVFSPAGTVNVTVKP